MALREPRHGPNRRPAAPCQPRPSAGTRRGPAPGCEPPLPVHNQQFHLHPQTWAGAKPQASSRRTPAGQQRYLIGVLARRVDTLSHALAAVDIHLQQRPVQEQTQPQRLARGQGERRLPGGTPVAWPSTTARCCSAGSGDRRSPDPVTSGLRRPGSSPPGRRTPPPSAPHCRASSTATATSDGACGSNSGASSRVSPAIPATTGSAPVAVAQHFHLRDRSMISVPSEPLPGFVPGSSSPNSLPRVPVPRHGSRAL